MLKAALKFLASPSVLNLLVIVGTAVLEEVLTEEPEIKPKKSGKKS